MYEPKTLCHLSDYFKNLSNRSSQGIYFYRINGFNDTIKEFIGEFYKLARKSGIVIEGKIPNPNEKQLSYYNEMMGIDFKLNMRFITSSLNKWLPTMNEIQRNNISIAIYDTLNSMHIDGKNDSIIKNAYIKFMCWFYYRFRQIVTRLGNDNIPKVLYEGEISNYELKFIEMLSKAGCDVVLLQYDGEQPYLKLDPKSQVSFLYNLEKTNPFPQDFNIASLRNDIEREQTIEKISSNSSALITIDTNSWRNGSIFEDILREANTRGSDLSRSYNCFCRINGVADKTTYLNSLFQFHLQLKNNQRKLVVVQHAIPVPTIDEISAIIRSNYATKEQMIYELSRNVKYSGNINLQNSIIKVFTNIMLEQSKVANSNLNKLTTQAVYLLCWIKRYQPQLLSNWKSTEIPCFIYLGGCKNNNEALFLRLLSKLPIDVLILCPNLNVKCLVVDQFLYEENNADSLTVENFPTDDTSVNIGTVAYHAERELDDMVYKYSGIYRNQQYNKAISISLKTMYEEIAILWKEDLKYRPNFSIVGNNVNLPVLFSKVSGIKDCLVNDYWTEIKQLIDEDTFLIKQAPFLSSSSPNPVKPFATEFLKNGKLNRNKIKSHSCYKYDFLREEMQEHLLDKLQLLIDQKIILGTFENGTEFIIVSIALNLNKEIIRLIQKFDFTKKNPKLIFINTTEVMLSIEDSILIAFLNLIGFDIVLFIPTGYLAVEKYFNKKILDEHQIGEYMYDLVVPNFNDITNTTTFANTLRSWGERIFKKGE